MSLKPILAILLVWGLTLQGVAQQPSYISQSTADAGYLTFNQTAEKLTPLQVATSAQIPTPVKESYRSVGRVLASAQGAQYFGSATYLGGGLWITNNHVVRDGYQFYVATKDGQTYPARLVSTVQSGEPDLALLQSQSLDHLLKAVPLAVNAVRPGDTVYPSGFDRGQLEWHTIWPARVLRWYANGDYESQGLFRRRGAISGNSGGPTFNALGELISPLHSTTGDPQMGNGNTVAVCFQSTRRFLLPWREFIVRSLERQWSRQKSQSQPQPIVINLAPNYQQPQPPPQPTEMVPIIRSDRSFRLELVPSTNPLAEPSQTQQCLPPGYGQPCPPQGYGQNNNFGNGFGQAPARPVIPSEELPSFQPEPTPQPTEIEINYDQLADALIPKMREDGGFRGEAGPAGKDGRDGSDGRDGKDGQDATSDPTQIANLESGVNQLANRVGELEALVLANAEHIRKLSDLTKPEQIAEQGDAAGEQNTAMVLYYTSRGCEGCTEVDRRVEQLKKRGAPIVVTRLAPKDAAVSGVPRIFIPGSNNHIVGKSNCMVYLAGVSW